jgi:hypothetical protein
MCCVTTFTLTLVISAAATAAVGPRSVSRTAVVDDWIAEGLIFTESSFVPALMESESVSKIDQEAISKIDQAMSDLLDMLTKGTKTAAVVCRNSNEKAQHPAMPKDVGVCRNIIDNVAVLQTGEESDVVIEKVEDFTMPKDVRIRNNNVNNEAVLRPEEERDAEQIDLGASPEDVGMYKNNNRNNAAVLQSEEGNVVGIETVGDSTMPEDMALLLSNANNEAVQQAEEECDTEPVMMEVPTIPEDGGMCSNKNFNGVVPLVQEESDTEPEKVEERTIPVDVGICSNNEFNHAVLLFHEESDKVPEKIADHTTPVNVGIPSNNAIYEAVLQKEEESDTVHEQIEDRTMPVDVGTSGNNASNEAVPRKEERDASLPTDDEGATLNELSLLPFEHGTGEECASTINITLQNITGFSILFFCLTFCLRCLSLPVVSHALVIEFVRGTSQLAILGCLSAFIVKFGNSRPLVVLIYLLFALTMACHEVAARTKYTYDDQFYHIFASITFSMLCSGLTAFALILKPEPM